VNIDRLLSCIVFRIDYLCVLFVGYAVERRSRPIIRLDLKEMREKIEKVNSIKYFATINDEFPLNSQRMFNK
jgi:hypothetical protein